MNYFLAFLTGGVGVAVVQGIVELIKLAKKHKYDREDLAELTERAWRKDVDKTLKALTVAQRYLLYDRIRNLGQKYIAEGRVDMEDRRILKQMHTSYHEGLGGNGDLDLLMKQVDNLPLKIKTEETK